MASTQEYLDFVLEQLSVLESVAYRKMMGEYVLYYREKVIGGIYNNRFLIKPVPAARALLPEAVYELPYEGAKPMILVDRFEDKKFLAHLIISMYDELPVVKRKNKKRLGE